MTPDKDITKTKGFKKLMIFLLAGIVFFSWLFFRINNASGFYEGWFEDFDDYAPDTLLDNHPNDSCWDIINPIYTPFIVKNDEIKYSNPNAVRKNQWWLNPKLNCIGENQVQKGILEFKYYDNGEKEGGFYLTYEDSPRGLLAYWYPDGANIKFYTADNTIYVSISSQTWHIIKIEWDSLYESLLTKSRIKIDDYDWSDWAISGAVDDNVNGFFIGSAYTGSPTYYDDFNLSLPALPPERIFGISPVSGTEVSNLNLEITIGYEGFDWAEYDGFTIAFWDERLHASSGVKVFVEDDLEPDGSGEVVVNLTDFGLDKKGKWYLTGLGFGTHLDIQSGMFLTTLGYVDFWSDELVDPEYYFIVVAEELPDLYPISDFEIWYGDNVVEFLEPTSFALAIADFFQPILGKIGEFHERTQIYLDTNEAYVRGKGLGDVFPILTGYVANISYFMGGFPLVSWFKYILIVLFAIFIIRAIFKFIPFFG